MNKTYLIILTIIMFLGGAFLFLRTRQSTPQTGEFNTTVQEANTTKPQDIVTLKNGDSYDLTASIVKKTMNGSEVKMLAYNNSIPGPLIKVPQGAEITLKFTNNTDVDSTIHSHGVRGDNKFDGVPGVTQDPVKPGKSFTYKLKFPDVGIFWYHPHVREDYAQELGLYGNFLVTPNTPDYWAEVDREEALFLDDILIENGQIATFDREVVDHTLMGRFGNTMLINGNENYKLSVKQGERVRFYLTNAANTRVFNFAIPNTFMKLVGSDNGKYESEKMIDTVVIGPSERQIVEVWFDKSGTYEIQHKTPYKSYTMGSIIVETNPVLSTDFSVRKINQDITDSITPLRPLFNKTPDKDIRLTLQMGSSESNSMNEHMMSNNEMMPDHEMSIVDIEKIEWEDDMNTMNAKSTTKSLKWKIIDQVTNKENMDIDWQFKKGDIVKIKIFNDNNSMHPMQHPIHIHGQKFLTITTNDMINTNLVWKDTTLIQTGDTVELLVQMDNPGDWMIHCHIPEHMEAGMMSGFKVI